MKIPFGKRQCQNPIYSQPSNGVIFWSGSQAFDSHTDRRESNSYFFVHISNCHFSIVSCGQNVDSNADFWQSCPDIIESSAEIKDLFESCSWLGYKVMSAVILLDSSVIDCSWLCWEFSPQDIGLLISFPNSFFCNQETSENKIAPHLTVVGC